MLLATSSAMAEVNIIPKPTKVVEGTGTFRLTDGQTIGFNNAAIKDAAYYLRRILTRATGYNKIKVRQGQGQISLVMQTPRNDKDESYTLSVTGKKVTIKAKSYRGIVNGIASLRQLLPDEIEKREVATGVDWTVPAVEIYDKPAYHWRGLMLDPSRHFYSVEETERFLDHMALYKYNKFHWHLIDGVGWRI